MFANPKMQIAARVIIRLKIAGLGEREPRFRGRTEVRRSPDDPGKVWRNSIENLGRSTAPRHTVGVGGKGGNVFQCLLRHFSALNLIDFLGKLREFLPVLRELLLPLLARFAAPPPNSGLEVLIYPAGN